jgi:hypothetical protein
MSYHRLGNNTDPTRRGKHNLSEERVEPIGQYGEA